MKMTTITAALMGLLAVAPGASAQTTGSGYWDALSPSLASVANKMHRTIRRDLAEAAAATPTFSVVTPQVLFEGPFRRDGGAFRNYDITPDGQRFLMVQEVHRPPTRVSQMVLVQHWVEELKQKVQAKR